MNVSYAEGSTESPLLTETVGENLEHTTARSRPRRLIVRHQGIRCTYSRIRRSNRSARQVVPEAWR